MMSPNQEIYKVARFSLQKMRKFFFCSKNSTHLFWTQKSHRKKCKNSSPIFHAHFIKNIRQQNIEASRNAIKAMK